MLPVSRWWIYQRERFPVFAHGLLIAAFSSSAVSFSWLLGGEAPPPAVASYGVAFVSCFLLFLQLRIADEFKDFEEDSLHRPYRPVPRGLVRLRELGWIGLGAAAVQLALAGWLAPGLVPLLLVTWAYLALMTREFFVREWICQHPIVYLWTHMLILPLADFYATACHWMSVGSRPPDGLFWFIALSFFNGVALEFGRKIRAPGDEENGVKTYSRIWGRKVAIQVWLGALGVTGVFSVMASLKISFFLPVVLVLGLLWSAAAWIGVRFLQQPITCRARLVEHFSGVWTLAVYLLLGLIPLLLRGVEVSR